MAHQLTSVPMATRTGVVLVLLLLPGSSFIYEDCGTHGRHRMLRATHPGFSPTMAQQLLTAVTAMVGDTQHQASPCSQPYAAVSAPYYGGKTRCK